MIAIIGAGKWGQAIAYAIGKNNKVSLYSAREFSAFNEECTHLIFVVRSDKTSEILEKFFKKNNDKTKVLIATKGLYDDKFMHEIFSPYFSNICVLSGPSFASEVMQDLPTALVISSSNLEVAKEFASFFPDNIKTYTNDDVIGAEICGSYKNVLAIASGICDGLNLGNNARAALISRGLIEMARFGEFFQAKENTFLGLSGAGDLFLTASSTLSRNYRAGFLLANNKSLSDIKDELKEVVEGINTAKFISKLSAKNNIYCPIANEITNILNGKNIKESIQDLLRK
ncbi:NAD(P)H-dependent glycerol-3-phosphate dehydrogenase [Campylobacter canadensis]|uniref:Glycerol-3-phosphate dehydrogenase [NAD(P)+] n=1 Tax=Campylobacter canadensis TaxID=449520 RepID=A0ABS7WRG2_9BACT|nr:NAD(P)H-dependent glycerol-3-phosphate dehydrogenase [Campylobacter canadensis]MBZ7986922.1 NAD(P)-dependent glycerol-3-phosphate dehydrogenase [Campylobacter canadensis]MBZ7994243.1 NAD(P)-dependent glycerol-3-phosphate dehydrogenase [Campylobacter canadensis]MBZ7995765.1 NAD(P)-dependent glycerol-3-phosphate dehydrogenase [Campylobacter canadensis]MBZ7997958.1 NAD(P)-dependent glycerol-3-phosphate dehydrogenase [Campylobacter canadensis]MBZ7999575.1 NAD(P)-dependent glycerol-3-phosphate d